VVSFLVLGVWCGRSENAHRGIQSSRYALRRTAPAHLLKAMNGQNRKDVRPGIQVDIVLKQNQRTGKRTRGTVKDVLTKSSHHPHGIKVRLETGEVGRVQEIIE
jgi:uncharacterized repeat protein (TIGR03833 family)